MFIKKPRHVPSDASSQGHPRHEYVRTIRCQHVQRDKNNHRTFKQSPYNHLLCSHPLPFAWPLLVATFVGQVTEVTMFVFRAHILEEEHAWLASAFLVLLQDVLGRTWVRDI